MKQVVNTKTERIWLTVLAIPSGKVASYGQIADLAGLPGRARYVSKAMRFAPEQLKLPWYRVLKVNGQLAFKADSELAKLQTTLLTKEHVKVVNNKVNMANFAWKPDLTDMLSKLDF